MSNTDFVLAIEDLTVSFDGFKAIDNLNLYVDKGELRVIIGPNGAGKTTCFNMIGGQIRPDAGRVGLNGEDVTGLPSRKLFRKGVGRTFQIAATFGSMTVLENVQLALLSHQRKALRLLGEATSAAKDEAHQLLAAVGLESQTDRPCDQLAYGDVKRLELAMALANAPRLLLMDEPTAGMAPRERHELMALVSKISEQRDLSVLFTEHDMDVVFGHADRIVVLDRGRLVAQGTQEEVRVDPEVKRIYLGDAG